MNKVLITILVVLGLLIVLIGGFVMWGASVYDNAVKLQEDVNAEWANVQSTYQRRMDLIPNLVETVKGYANFEQETLTGVIEARSKATSVTIDPSKVTPQQFAQFQQAQDGVSAALSRLMVVVERYPDLKANQNFLDLQAQLEGTENRINVARQRYNESIREYNTYVRGFFKRFALGIFGGGEDFSVRKGFEASEGADKAPQVKF
ncbi:MAG: LemA family protein [Cyclobacteriaceae bacterium]|nr:LemA family protein [Cyclobacteriaceae bacterium]UYN86984.1 MAG: LemA family protein [Cyclobacteriaceae bacterium]